MREGGVLNIRIKPEIPQHLFVGAMDGPASCTPDDNLYDVWPKFLVMVLLQGQQHFVMDGEHFRIDAGDEENPEPVVFMLNILGLLRIFDQIYVMRNGVIKNAIDVIMTYVYDTGIQKYQLGFASAISVMVLLATLVMTAFVWKITGFGQED